MASGQTTNYGLNQWAAEDNVLRQEFNQDNAKIEREFEDIAEVLPRIVTGIYEGNGAASQFIPLDSSPKAVIVWRYGVQQGGSDGDIYGGFALPGHSANSAIEITDSGFTAYYSGKAKANVAGFDHYYLAVL